MRISRINVVTLALTVLFILSSIVDAHARKVNWEAFSVNLVKAIKSGHPGLQQSAMQRIIRYADSLNTKDAVYPLVQIFRFNDNDKVRRLAMVALAKINSDHAISYLYKYMKFEENVMIRHQCVCIINDYCKSKSPKKEHEIAELAAKL
ncbi:MAG: hypothetical protein JXR46_01465 [Calditrichaceae bacterium]|nr:hypothetical protein [Calditrichaceae bacterium]MBN2707686.1 hypothetical protein [Calditrichaceae bacterium]RQV96500.1 MAG: hypothetical protein EH224_04585 [Calditrichota bacterium]